jgi:phage/plasmid-associated DNA primase
MDVLGEFLAAFCELAPNATATAKDLYAAYIAWCEDQKMSDRERLSKKSFAHALAERGLQAGKNRTARFWCGIRLKDAAEEAD